MDAIKTVERRLAAGTLKHGGTGMMAWCLGNAKVEPKGNAVVITKQVAGTGKIDPLLALINAAKLMAKNPVAGTMSIYAEAPPPSPAPPKVDASAQYEAARARYAERFFAED
jgi:phage terminase large subunit-like protein